MPDDATLLSMPSCPQGSPKAPKSPSPLRLTQHEGLRDQVTWEIRAQPHAGRKWEVKGNTPSTGSGVANLLHRGAALPSHRSISLSQAWKNPDPGFNPAVVFKAGSCSWVPAGPASSSFPCCVLLLAARSPQQTSPGRLGSTRGSGCAHGAGAHLGQRDQSIPTAPQRAAGTSCLPTSPTLRGHSGASRLSSLLLDHLNTTVWLRMTRSATSGTGSWV